MHLLCIYVYNNCTFGQLPRQNQFCQQNRFCRQNRICRKNQICRGSYPKVQLLYINIYSNSTFEQLPRQNRICRQNRFCRGSYTKVQLLYIIYSIRSKLPRQIQICGQVPFCRHSRFCWGRKKTSYLSLHVNKTDIGCINHPLSLFLLVHIQISFASHYSHQPLNPIYFSQAQLVLSYLPHISHFYCMFGPKFLCTKLFFVPKILQ